MQKLILFSLIIGLIGCTTLPNSANNSDRSQTENTKDILSDEKQSSSKDSESNDLTKGVIDDSSLNGKIFMLNIDKNLSENAKVQFPDDELEESDYEESKNQSQYDISFSNDGQVVTIEPGSISGQRVNNENSSIFYELDQGLFAGGRLVIWESNNNFRAEFTTYGSGFPIIKSERGRLEAK